MGWLPNPGDRDRRERGAPDAEPPRRGPPLPGAAREADLARRAGGDRRRRGGGARPGGAPRLRPPPGSPGRWLSLIHISEPTRLGMISYAVFCLKKKKQTKRT